MSASSLDQVGASRSLPRRRYRRLVFADRGGVDGLSTCQPPLGLERASSQGVKETDGLHPSLDRAVSAKRRIEPSDSIANDAKLKVVDLAQRAGKLGSQLRHPFARSSFAVLA